MPLVTGVPVTVDLTSSIEPGLVTPIPTLPVEVIRTLSPTPPPAVVQNDR